ncbi:MAG: 16S rRNA (cytosine(967)-C(5))-methyltransferase RsmB [Blautia sp.]|nr:16S rRNA (cytosine(967)-C(5))-methyltransferase RsmB [Blautia sp.]
MADNIREIVLDTLLELEKGGEFSHRLIRAVLDKYDYLDSRDKSFIKRLAEGTIERQIELDYDLDHISSLPVRKMKPLIRCLLRMSAYQMLYMDTVPDSAVCNEAVKLAGKRGFRSLQGFVNGVLRNLSRQKGSIPLPDARKEPEKYLSVKYSMPVWLVELWLSEYGRETVEKMLAGLLRVHPVSIRFSSKLSERERQDRVAQLTQAGVKVTRSPYLPCVYSMEHGENVGMLPGFAEGVFTVQDVSSALAVEAAQIQDTDFVMDLCAAPGGKSILAAEKADKVLARDVSIDKTDVIEENIRRMGVKNIEVQVFDATEFDGGYEEKADVVLMDVPCSGLGVMGRKRDIKYRVTPEGLESLAKLQRHIVDSSWRYVKPGGTLIYSTCTIHSEENEAMVRYISENLPFEPVSLENVLPSALWKQKTELEAGIWQEVREQLTEQQQASCIQLLPGYMECDGFFFARFRRKTE